MTEASQGNQPLQWKLFIRRRASATQGTPPGKDELKWVANTTTLIHGEQDALLVDTFLSEAQTGELADWIAASGKRLSMIYITHAHPDHFFGLKLLRDRFPDARAIAPAGLLRPAGACPRSISPMPIPIISLGSSCCATAFRMRAQSRPRRWWKPCRPRSRPKPSKIGAGYSQAKSPQISSPLNGWMAGRSTLKVTRLCRLISGHTDTDHTTCLYVPSIGL